MRPCQKRGGMTFDEICKRWGPLTVDEDDLDVRILHESLYPSPSILSRRTSSAVEEVRWLDTSSKDLGKEEKGPVRRGLVSCPDDIKDCI